MRSILVAAAVLSLAFGSLALAKPACRDAAGKFTKCPTAAPAAPAKAPPNCVKGKLCGNACIAKDKVCHKP